MYKEELTKAMQFLAEKPESIFIGQAVGTYGTFMYDTYKDVPENKRFEFPVCESLQLQFSIGMSMQGYCPISIFPRWNFLLLAIADIVNTLDKLNLAPIIIRTAVGPTQPIYPGVQHVGDFSDAIKQMINPKKTNLYLAELDETDIVSCYKQAYNNWKKGRSAIVVEVGDLYES